jgi:hypothetical protein
MRRPNPRSDKARFQAGNVGETAVQGGSDGTQNTAHGAIEQQRAESPRRQSMGDQRNTILIARGFKYENRKGLLHEYAESLRAPLLREVLQ